MSKRTNDLALRISIVFFGFALTGVPLVAGPMPAEHRGVIHDLFISHRDFSRQVEITKQGYRATTSSENPEKVALLLKHIKQMETRLDSGMSVRRWDPAFAELREHYADMEVRVEKIEKGVVVIVNGKSPEAIKVARNHAKIISGFIEKGTSEMHARHAAALESTSGGTETNAVCTDGNCKSRQKDCEACQKESKANP